VTHLLTTFMAYQSLVRVSNQLSKGSRGQKGRNA
jgi:hypothetical protein